MADDLFGKYFLNKDTAKPAQKPQPKPNYVKTAEMLGVSNKDQKAKQVKAQNEQIAIAKRKYEATARTVAVRTKYGTFDVDHKGEMTPAKYAEYQTKLEQWASNEGLKEKAKANRPDVSPPEPVPSEFDFVKKGINENKLATTVLDLSPLRLGGKMVDKVAPGVSKRVEDFGKALQVSTDQKDMATTGLLAVPEALLRQAVNIPGQIFEGAGTIANPKTDNVGVIQDSAETLANVLPLIKPLKAGKEAFDIARKAGKGIAESAIKGGVASVMDSAGFKPNESSPNAQKVAEPMGVDTNQVINNLGAVRNADGTAKFMPKPKDVPVSQKPFQMPASVPEGTPATSARKAMVAEDRANMGLGELEDPLRKTFGESLDNARAKGYDDAWAMREAESVTAKPRALNDEETAGMSEAMARLKNLHKETLAKLANATDQTEIDALRDSLSGIEKQFDTISEAVKLSGTEKGRALASQKLTLNEGYDLISIKSRAKAAKGAELTSAETAKYEEMVRRLDEADKKIADLEVANIDLQKTLQSLPGGAKGGRRIARTATEIKAARADALEKLKASKPTAMYSGLAPLGDVDYKALGQYILTFAEEGVGKVEDVIQAAIAHAKTNGVEIKETDAKKALIEWGTPKKSNRAYDNALYQRDRLRKEIRMSIEDQKKTSFQKLKSEASALPRAMQSTLDFSAVLRQGLHLSAGNPLKAAQAYGKAFKATISPVYAAKLDRELYASPMALTRKKAGLYLAQGETTNLAEEAFMSNWVSKIPGFGALSSGAERHYNTFLNQLRSTVFDAEIAKYPAMSLDQQKALADFINVSTGRGRMGSSEILSNVFFSPRFMASRLQAPLDAVALTKSGRAMWKSPGARSQMVKSWTGMIGTGLTMAALAKQFGGEVSLDPDSPDFGKIKMGDTRFDIWGGYLPQVRLLARLGKMTASTKKPAYGKDALEITTDFLKYKVSPNVGAAAAVISKQDAVGNPRFVNAKGEISPATVAEDLPKFYSPLIVKDLAEIWGLSFDTDSKKFNVESSTPLPVKAIGSAAVFHGVGSQTYKKK